MLEYFKQFNAKHLKSYIDFLPKRIQLLQDDIVKLHTKIRSLATDSKAFKDATEELNYKQQQLQTATEDQKKYTPEAFNRLSQQQKNIHQKAFVVNTDDPYQRQLNAFKLYG